MLCLPKCHFQFSLFIVQRCIEIFLLTRVYVIETWIWTLPHVQFVSLNLMQWLSPHCSNMCKYVGPCWCIKILRWLLYAWIKKVMSFCDVILTPNFLYGQRGNLITYNITHKINKINLVICTHLALLLIFRLYPTST